MKVTDKTLMEIYLLGFEQELQGVFKNEYEKDSLESRAYEIGSLHAIVGDDVSSIDYLSNEEILKKIRG